MVARFILTGAEKDGDAQHEAKQYGDILFTDDRLSGYRSIVHKTYFVLEYVVCNRSAGACLDPESSALQEPRPMMCNWRPEACLNP